MAFCSKKLQNLGSYLRLSTKTIIFRFRLIVIVEIHEKVSDHTEVCFLSDKFFIFNIYTFVKKTPYVRLGRFLNNPKHSKRHKIFDRYSIKFGHTFEIILSIENTEVSLSPGF
jgi:hypothetical protein